MKGYSAFLKAPASLEPRHQIVYCHIQGSYHSAEAQSVYSTVPVDWARRNMEQILLTYGHAKKSLSYNDALLRQKSNGLLT